MSTEALEKGQISVDTENLFPIIKKWLYSEHDIFVRELVSNACDAITKLNRLADLGQYKGEVPEGKVNLQIDKDAKTLTISDNGLGMTSEEIKKYINQIAFSGAKEFLSKYDNESKEGGIIGHFGMGFFSSFMVSEFVEIDSLSHQEGSTAVYWKCDGTTEYEMGSGKRKEVGTDIILHMNKESEDFLDEDKIKNLVKRYSNFLPYEIQVNGTKANEQTAIWNQSPASLKDEDYKELYKKLFPMDGEPLFWVHFNVDYPFNLKGIVYFPRIRQDFDIKSKGRLQLYCNNVFVSDNIIDIVPQYLNLLQGVIDSPDIPLNVSRSFLQGDPQIKKIGNHIVSKIADKLNQLYKNEREEFEKFWEDIHTFIKYGAVSDEKFYDKVKDCLIMNKVGGGTLTIAEYQEKNPKLKDKILYTSDEASQVTYLNRAKEEGLDVVIFNSIIDNHFMQQMEMKNAPLRFQRIDSDALENVLDEKGDDKKEEEKNNEDLVKMVKDLLGQENLQVKTKKFANEKFAFLLTQSEYMRRLNEMNSFMQQGDAMGGLNFNELVVNENHELVQKFLADKDNTAAVEQNKKLAQHLYDLALLQQGELKGEALERYVKQSTEIVTEQYTK